MDLQQLSFNKTRIAPTPSGYLHLGNVLSFSLTAWMAQQTGAKVLLRIDDLDKQRVQPQYIADIFDTLHFLQLPWSEGPRNVEELEKEYAQENRMPLYEQALQQLVNNNAVFACNCSRAQLAQQAVSGVYLGTCRDKELPLDTHNVNWRLKTEGSELLTIQTLSGVISANLPPDMQDMIVRKKDGYPSYQLSSVVDDLHFGVDLIVRGKDLWHSTLAQQYLAAQLPENSFANTGFYHHPLLMERGEVKLSKSAGATSVQYLRAQGQQSQDIYTAIGRMLDLKVPVGSWQELADVFLRQAF